MNAKDYNLFYIEFRDLKGTKGTFIIDSCDEVSLQIGNFEIPIRDEDESKENILNIADIDLSNKLEELKIGQIVNITDFNVDVIIEDIVSETNEEFNAFWERVEMEEY